MRLISRSFARFIRCCSASNEFLPSSSNATISPSSTAFTWSTSSWIMWSSGYCDVTSRPVRVISFVSPVVSSARQRIPSSFGSNHQRVVVERLPPALGEHRLEARRRRDQRRVLRARQEREPVGPGLHEVELEPRVAPAVQAEGDLLVVPLDRLVPAVVEDPDLAGAVVALGDRALERPVLERVVLGAHGEALVALRGRQPFRAPPTRAARRRAPGARRSAAASRGACGSRTSCPRPAAAPGAGSGVPSKSRLRRYSARFGSFDAAMTSSEVRGRCGLARRSSVAQADRLERVRQVHRLGAHALEQVADAREALPHVVDPEVLRLEPALDDLVPRERRRDRRARLGPQRVRGRDVRARCGSCCGR